MLWELLHHSLPLWKRPRDAETNESEEDKGPPSEEGGGEGERDRPSRMVTAQFTSAANGKPLTRAKETLMVRHTVHTPPKAAPFCLLINSCPGCSCVVGLCFALLTHTCLKLKSTIENGV